MFKFPSPTFFLLLPKGRGRIGRGSSQTPLPSSGRRRKKEREGNLNI